MPFELSTLLATLTLLLAMLGATELGRWIGRVRYTPESGIAKPATGPVEAAVYGLFGLLLAFTFSGAATRFEGRRHLIGQEANAIGTAYLRLDLLAPADRDALRGQFKSYLTSRLESYTDLSDSAATARRQVVAEERLQLLWDGAIVATKAPGAAPQAPMLLLPSLNAMIDMTTTRRVATEDHPPTIIYVLLFALGVVSALLTGYILSHSPRRNWPYQVVYAATIALTFGVILDLEFPRLGLIRIDAADATLRALLASMQ